VDNNTSFEWDIYQERFAQLTGFYAIAHDAEDAGRPH